MEPVRLDSDAAIEAALRAHAPDPLPDRGFSARVVAALPTPRVWGWDVRPLLLFWIPGLAGAFFALHDTPSGAAAERVVQDSLNALSGSWGPLGLAAALLACLYPFFDGAEGSGDRS